MCALSVVKKKHDTGPEAVCCCLQTCNFGFDMRAIYTIPHDMRLNL